MGEGGADGPPGAWRGEGDGAAALTPNNIATPNRIPEIFLKEFNDLVGITARKVEIRLDLPPTVEWKVLGGWSAEYKDGRLHISVGDMLAGNLQDVYIKLHIPADQHTAELALDATAFGQGKDGVVLESRA